MFASCRIDSCVGSRIVSRIVYDDDAVCVVAVKVETVLLM